MCGGLCVTVSVCHSFLEKYCGYCLARIYQTPQQIKRPASQIGAMSHNLQYIFTEGRLDKTFAINFKGILFCNNLLLVLKYLFIAQIVNIDSRLYQTPQKM